MMNEMSPDISFRQVADICHGMDCWGQLDVEELDDIFQDTIEDFNRRHRNKARDKVYDMQRDFYKALESAIPSIKPGRDQWKDISTRFASQESFIKLDDLDRFQVFEDYMREEIERFRDEKERAAKRSARKHRERFVELLDEYKELITSSPDMKWSEFVGMIKQRQEYIDLIGTKHSSQPYDLFAEMRSRWKREEDSLSRNPNSSTSSIHNDSI